MPRSTSIAVLRDLQTLFDTGTATGLTDRQLLDRFTASHDATAEAAFEVLLQRHGPMVLRVCRNVLRDPNDVHDAFQAAFLVLISRKRSIRKLDSVGGWLYGVACRVAARARVDAARRRAAEHRAALRIVEAVDSPHADETANGGLGPIVQEEVRRLPEKYRAVVALCYWQGLSQEQAAVQLGCPLGTVRSRLARARNLLRGRLTRRGMAPLAAVVTAGFDRAPATASSVMCRLAPVPIELARATIQAAVGNAGPQLTAQVVSGFAASLAHNVLWSMTMIKIKAVVVSAVVVGLVGSGGWFVTSKGSLARAQPANAQKTTRPGNKRKTEASGTSYSVVKVQTAITKLVPDGSRVKKGDVVCELDSASLTDQLINQKITSKSAEAISENAALAREAAEFDVVEYAEGIFKHELLEVMSDKMIAEAELALADDQLTEAVKTAQSANVARGAVPVARLAVLRARLKLENAHSRRKLLLDYRKGKRIKALKSGVEKARSEELAKGAIWQLELRKERDLERQIAGCTMVAPTDGTVVYAPGIENGTTVRERQALFQVTAAFGAEGESH